MRGEKKKQKKKQNNKKKQQKEAIKRQKQNKKNTKELYIVKALADLKVFPDILSITSPYINININGSGS